MTPQSAFMVCAPIEPAGRAALEELLASMCEQPGQADPRNALLPFGDFPTLHFARIVLLEDLAASVSPPPMLTLLGDVDGTEADFLEELAARAEAGLRRIFSFCTDFGPGTDLLAWLRAHNVKPAVNYVNWLGRTVVQVGEEAALHAALRTHLATAQVAGPPAQTWRDLVAFVRAEQAQGRLPLSAPAPDPPGWQVGEVLHAAGMIALLVLAAPLLLIGLVPYLWGLRRLEASDAPITPRPSPEHAARLSAIEDHDVSNQFSAYGSVKPGTFRLWTLTVLLWVVGGTTRHIFTRGRLARVPTIHFARWVFMDGGQRLFFASNYDGSLDSYMDDFINKVAFGLNLVFSNGVGYPRTRFLVLDGAKDEQAFKDYIRRRQLVSAVWYKAYPGLTAYDLARNAVVRAGIEAPSPTDADARRLLQML